MKVIHDDELGGIMTIPLIVDWGIKRTCQVRDCDEKTNTIVVFDASETPNNESVHLGICEKHHKEASESGKFHYTVDL